MEAALADALKFVARDATGSSTLAKRQAAPEFPAHQQPDPSEIPTNIGIFITAGVVFLLLFVLCLQDHRKRARITDSYKDTNPFS